MTGTRFLKMVAAPALALTMLSGCATGFNAQVARFQQLPPAQGETFTVVAEDSSKAGGLEFAHYADLVSARMAQFGYRPVADPATAQLVVRMDYDVDRGRERIQTAAIGPSPFIGFPYHGGWGRGWGRGYGWGMGFNDPWLFGGGYNAIDSYTVYGSMMRLRIDRAGTGKSLFEGTARAQSLSNKLTYLVPNLIDAMFTGFPGNSGEEIKVTVPPEPKTTK